MRSNDDAGIVVLVSNQTEGTTDMAKCIIPGCGEKGSVPQVKSRNPKAVAKKDPLCPEHLKVAIASGGIWK